MGWGFKDLASLLGLRLSFCKLLQLLRDVGLPWLPLIDLEGIPLITLEVRFQHHTSGPGTVLAFLGPYYLFLGPYPCEPRSREPDRPSFLSKPVRNTCLDQENMSSITIHTNDVH